ncbi:MAG: glycosyltransferase, partial [Candidatus Latescibacteria bacterium]|nr:glycosyltransferase [Candidatus Latescibacterota bacterium]
MIPAYNEETSVGLVLEAIPKKWMDQIVVVDNGSTDTTAKVAQSSYAEVVSEPRRGYGQARLTGIAHVKNDTDIVV